MIDLAEQAGAEFSSSKKSGMLLCLKLLYIGETERELGKKRNMIFLVLMVLFLEYATACNAKVCLTIRRSF
jgi:hypothetical protein